MLNAPYVNQAEIARALGLSQSTVSIGLKGDARVARKTRDAIEKKADELGYVPDPNLFALSLYRTKTKAEKIVAGLAWVTNYPTEDGWELDLFKLYRRGAVERAEKLGYRVYDFWLGDPEISPERLRQILLSRGIRGLLLPPQQMFRSRIEFDFSDFAAVTFGHSLESPALNRVGNYQHQSVRLGYRSLQGLGYKRIGLLLGDAVDRRVDRNFSGGYHTMNPNGQDEEFIQPHLFQGEDIVEEEFEEWFNRWKPDALLLSGGAAAQLRAWMKRKGFEEGKDLAIAELNLNSDDGTTAGVDQQPELIGQAAVNVLDSLLNHFEYGIPKHPLHTMVESVWRDGESAPKKG